MVKESTWQDGGTHFQEMNETTVMQIVVKGTLQTITCVTTTTPGSLGKAE